MLVLSRKEGQRITVGNNITIIINRITGNRVAIGIDAPHDVRVLRGELTPFEEEASAMGPAAPPVPAPPDR